MKHSPLTLPPLFVLTPGDPAGIGPDCCLLAASAVMPGEIVVVASQALLAERAAQLGLAILFRPFQPGIYLKPQPNVLTILDVPLIAPVIAGVPDPANAAYVLNTLQLATALCLDHTAMGLITGPVSKAVIAHSGVHFTGHTEYLRELTNSTLTQMLFVHDQMKVSLVTTHIPLNTVCAHLNAPLIAAHIRCLAEGLQRHWNISHPRIAILGVNPHAGEQGLFGTEEQTIIQPAMMLASNPDWTLVGPLSADTIFSPALRTQFDGILAMYHDQALGPLKALGFGEAINVTLGLPFVRTSVDHGTAFDRAGTGNVDCQSLINAIQLAFTL